MKRVLYHCGILRLAFDDIPRIKLSRVDETDHNPVHGIFHIGFKIHVVGVDDL